MKIRLLIILTLVACSTAFSLVQTTPSCDQKEIKNRCKQKLDPYKYDNAKVTNITFKTKPQVKEIEVPLFIGEKYRFVFSRSGVNHNVGVNVYNKDKDAKNRELLFTSKDVSSDQKEFIFEPTKRTRTLYVSYEVPAVSADSASSGCVAFMLGYK